MRVILRRGAGLLVRSALLFAIIWGSNLWLVRIRDSIHSHRSVLAGQPSLSEPTSPLVQQVVLVLVGGLTYEASLDMPYLNTLRRQGLEAPCMGHYPSYSQSAWTTLLTGAGPEISDAPLVNLPPEQLGFLTVDGLFTEAERANLTTAIAGFHWWERMVPDLVVDRRFFVSSADTEGDRQVSQAALEFLNNVPPNLVLVHFSQVDSAARAYGTGSQEYIDAVQRVDSLLREIGQAISLRRNVLVVASDHGYLANGGQGGADMEVVTTPLVMVGARVQPGPHDQVDQSDVAPTIAALLGLAVPSAAQGEILFDALIMDEAESTEKWVSWSQQRVELSDLYLESIGQGPLTEGPKGDAQVAYSSLLVRNYGSARSLAEFAVQEATKEMIRGRNQRLVREQRQRLPVVALLAAPIAYLLWRRWTRTTAVLLTCAVTTVLIYNLLFLWEGQVYSLSTMGHWWSFATDTLVRMATALVPAMCVLIWLAWHQKKRSPLEIATLNYSFALVLALLLALPLSAAYVLNGVEVTWQLPQPLAAFVQLSSLVQLGMAAFLATFLPTITVPLDRLLRWVAPRIGSLIR
ncbi:MAG: alkaline phosphatase family protein [Anaerolineae bacterium]|nr:alkaline phosphatase family protein [Anaerolineae bacterium]